MNPIAAFISMVTNYRAGEDLTPLARAFFRQVEGIIVSAIFAGIVAVTPYLNGQAVDWTNVLHLFLISFCTTFGLAVTKYFKAQGDAPQNPAPVPAPAAPAAAPVSGGGYPVSPFAQAVPLPRSQRMVAHVH